ncbi:hopanoid C-3 methylase [Kordia sp. SMS9]|uniref:B12-binding domain-containing radical SAM protein n=1 Tax=Kordia sp. SMS9 TaxID=2282170 RepID=UPI000E0DB4C4|nr:radical SAM protein [Kordia sp. SMS9]AXG71552.1 hopanoid C-3 methylase [Kordia sp. SMS9]
MEKVIENIATVTKPRLECIDFLLVHLPFREGPINQTFQLGLLCVATSLKEDGFNVKVIDDCELDTASFIELYKKHRPRILGFHVNTDSVPIVGRVIEKLRTLDEAPELIIFGGPHVSVADAELLEKGWGHIVVRGEGEFTAREIGRWFLKNEGTLEDIKGITYVDENNEIKRTPNRPFIKDLDSLPFPDISLLVRAQKYPAYQILTGRGCPYHCTFCAEGIIGVQYRYRSAKSVLEEIRNIVGNRKYTYLSILDDTFLVNRKRVEEIAKGLIEEYAENKKLKWFCESRVDFIIKNPELFKLLRKAGLVRVQIGIESGSQKVLDTYNKKVKVEEIIRAVEILAEANIPSIYGNFIIGGPFETEETIDQSIALVKTLYDKAPGRMECGASYLTLFPGTELTVNSDKYDLEILDTDVMTTISLQHPVVIPKGKTKHWVIGQYHRFYRELQKHHLETIINVPLKLIDEHLKLRDYGMNTQNSNHYLVYPCIKKHEEIRSRQKIKEDISDSELLQIIPRRSDTIGSLNNHFAVIAYPTGPVIFNDMAGKIYELCSGKYRLHEIIEILSANNKNVPPEPYFTEQVVAVIKDMKKRYLLTYSDL